MDDKTTAERLTRLETQQEHNMKSIGQLTDMMNRITDMQERMTRMEERHQFATKVVFGAVSAVVTIEVGGVLYVLQKMIDAGLP